MNTKDKATNPFMTTDARDKLANIESELTAAVATRDSYFNQYRKAQDAVESVRAEIEALKEALTPKRGDIYKNVYTSLEYILARVAHRKYSLINLLTGERYIDGAEDMDKVFGNNPENFVKVRG